MGEHLEAPGLSPANVEVIGFNVGIKGYCS
jgi:hypothetical protein